MNDTRVRFARRCGETSTDLREICAAVLRTSPPDSVISGPTAARLHELWLPDGVDEVHVAAAVRGRRPRDMSRTRRTPLLAHRRMLSDSEVTAVDGLVVTTVERTWLDLAGSLKLPDLVAAGDRALQVGATSESLDAVLSAARGRRYVRRARAAFALLDRRSRSRPESHLRVAVSAPDLPRFEVNKPVFRREGGWLAEPDLSLAEARLALEYQGADHADVGRMRRDITRAVDLRSQRWKVLEYGPAQVFGRPWQIEAEVRDVIRRRAPHLLGEPR